MTIITNVHLPKLVSADLMLNNAPNHKYIICRHQHFLFITKFFIYNTFLFVTQYFVFISFALARGNNLSGKNLG